MYSNNQIAEKILRLPAVKEMTGLSRSSIYAYMNNGAFPRSIRLGQRSVGWKEAAVIEWINERTTT